MLYLYPYSHPSHAQSQVDLSNLDLTQFPDVSKVQGYEVTMEPGDVLYLPPMVNKFKTFFIF